jgi:DNA end-binding protein Ku
VSTRSIWNGTLTFGLISLPVKLYAATRSKTVRFNQLHASDNVRIQTKRFCPLDKMEVPSDEIVRGYEISPDRYVVVEDAELETLAPEATRTIEIEDFVDLKEIDPIYYDQPYYVVPTPGGTKSYQLLLQVMRDTEKVAIARVVLRSRERLVAVRPYGEALLMATMIFGDELNPASDLAELGDGADVGQRELDTATQLVTSLVTPFDITKYRDTYRGAVLDLIERKANGEEIAVQPPAPATSSPAPDLMSALEASLADVRKRSGTNGNGTGTRRKAAAKGAGSGKPRRAAASRSRRGEKH